MLFTVAGAFSGRSACAGGEAGGCSRAEHRRADEKDIGEMHDRVRGKSSRWVMEMICCPTWETQGTYIPNSPLSICCHSFPNI